jgi:hypothetical protein
MAKVRDKNWLYLAASMAPLALGGIRLALIAGRGEITLATIIGEALGVLILAILANWALQLAFPRAGKPNGLAAILVSAISLGVAALMLLPLTSSQMVCVAIVAASQLLTLGYAATALKPVLAKAAKKKRNVRR